MYVHMLDAGTKELVRLLSPISFIVFRSNSSIERSIMRNKEAQEKRKEKNNERFNDIFQEFDL